MKRDFLEKLGITVKETIDAILDENSKDIGAAKGTAADVEAERDRLKTENESYKTQIADRDKQLEELKKAGSVDDLKKQIEELQTANNDAATKHAAEMKQLRIDTAIEKAIMTAGGLNTKAIKALLDASKITVADDGTVNGIADQVKALAKAEDSKMLFKAETKPQIKGAKVGESSDTDPVTVTKADFSKMGYKARLELKQTNPELYEQLTGATNE